MLKVPLGSCFFCPQDFFAPFVLTQLEGPLKEKEWRQFMINFRSRGLRWKECGFGSVKAWIQIWILFKTPSASDYHSKTRITMPVPAELSLRLNKRMAVECAEWNKKMAVSFRLANPFAVVKLWWASQKWSELCKCSLLIYLPLFVFWTFVTLPATVGSHSVRLANCFWMTCSYLIFIG